MSAPQHTKPFNLEHAKAGAPIAMRNGIAVEILKWDREKHNPIIGISADDQQLHSWGANGAYGGANSVSMGSLVMTPLGYIDGKPVFTGDRLVRKDGSCGETTAKEMSRQWPDWTWPEPEKQYPVTGMTGGELLTYFGGNRPTDQCVVDAANAALRHAVDAGQVMPIADVAAMQGKLDKAEATLEQAGYTDNGGVLWKPPLGLSPDQRADYKQQSMELGKAERLLESLGYRSAGNGEWKPPAPLGIITLVGSYSDADLEAFKKTLNEAQARAVQPKLELIKHPIDRAARDMAIAEAVKDACYVAAMNCPAGHEGTVIRQVHLTSIIEQVKP